MEEGLCRLYNALKAIEGSVTSLHKMRAIGKKSDMIRLILGR